MRAQGELYRSSASVCRHARGGGHVYFVRGTGDLVKIGMTARLEDRVETVCKEVPFPTELIHAIKTSCIMGAESHFHMRFLRARVFGEWFYLPHAKLEPILEIEKYHPLCVTDPVGEELERQAGTQIRPGHPRFRAITNAERKYGIDSYPPLDRPERQQQRRPNFDLMPW